MVTSSTFKTNNKVQYFHFLLTATKETPGVKVSLYQMKASIILKLYGTPSQAKGMGLLHKQLIAQYKPPL